MGEATLGSRLLDLEDVKVITADPAGEGGLINGRRAWLPTTVL